MCASGALLVNFPFNFGRQYVDKVDKHAKDMSCSTNELRTKMKDLTDKTKGLQKGKVATHSCALLQCFVCCESYAQFVISGASFDILALFLQGRSDQENPTPNFECPAVGTVN